MTRHDKAGPRDLVNGIALASPSAMAAVLSQVELKSAEALAGRVSSAALSPPMVIFLLTLGCGLLSSHPAIALGGTALSLGMALLRRALCLRVHLLPHRAFLAWTYVLGILVALQLGVAHLLYVRAYGFTQESFLFVYAMIAVASGGVANLAPARWLQMAQVLGMLSPSLLGLALYCSQTQLVVTIELGMALYAGAMYFIGRRVCLDYVLGLEREVRLAVNAVELERAKLAAEDSSRAKGEFLANMSHEIRTPLNGVLGMAQVLAASELTVDQRESVATIIESGEGLLSVLSDVLDFSKIESRKLRIEPVAFSPASLSRQVLSLFEHTARPKGLRLELELSDSLPPYLLADAMRVRQVLLNVISNALKFTARGSVTLSAGYAEGRVSWAVRDTGAGMSPQTVAKLFRPFEQGDVSTTRRFGGTGLGLAISLHLAKLMAGTLSVSTQPGSGSTFTLAIPADVCAPGTVAPGPRPSPPVRHGARPKVLVAEDNVVNQRVAVRLLEQLGCETQVANDGAEVLRRLHGQRFDLILMDCQMPELDGYEATRAIRQGEPAQGRHQAIVGLTASAIDGDRERALSAGMDDYLTKPIKVSQLEEMVARYCPPS